MPHIRLPPFVQAAELIPNDIHPDTSSINPVPNEPFICDSKDEIDEFLHREVVCKVLDELAPNFFVFAKRRSSHLDTLHEYIGAGRRITIPENPGFHLLRIYNDFYIKPIPACLLSHNFWKTYLTPHPPPQAGCSSYPTSSLSIPCRSALGFLRTYAHLIKHESDFHIAQSTHLLPTHVTYLAFQHFIRPFLSIPDTAVSPRYHYGHIRLTRLNLAVRILRPPSLGKRFPWSYHGLHYHSGEILADFAAPLLFLFACFTLILSSMQVGLAALPADRESFAGWIAFVSVSRWFSVVVILGILGMAGWVCFAIAMYVLIRVVVGYRVHKKTERRTRQESGEEQVNRMVTTVDQK